MDTQTLPPLVALCLAVVWRIIAAVDYLSGEDAIYRVLEGQTLPAQYRDAGPTCEHCRQSRTRKTVYILMADSGEYRQVGSTCLRDFTGQDESELVASFREQLEADEEERIRVSRLIDTAGYLAQVSAVIREYGWLGATKAREIGQECTASFATAFKLQTTEADTLTAQAAISWAKTIPDDEPNDYLHNLHVLAGQIAIDRKHCNLVASMIVAHQRAQAREAERTSQAAVSQHFGTIGKRETFTLTVERVFSIDGQYGVTHIHTMRDEAGNVAVWFCSGAPLEVGRTHTLKCTVKSHGQRDGIAQTVLTRCKEVQS